MRDVPKTMSFGNLVGHGVLLFYRTDGIRKENDKGDLTCETSQRSTVPQSNVVTGKVGSDSMTSLIV